MKTAQGVTQIPIEISSNSSQAGSAPQYTVEVVWCEDMAKLLVRWALEEHEVDTAAWHQQLQAIKLQCAPKTLTLAEGQPLAELEKAVAQHVEDISKTISAAAAATDGQSPMAAVDMICIAGPVDLPSDFCIIDMPGWYDLHQWWIDSIISNAGIGSAIVYVSARRPNSTLIRNLMIQGRGVYQLTAPMPIVAAYFHGAGTDIETAAADAQFVQDAIYIAVDEISASTMEFDRRKLSQCIENTVFLDRDAADNKETRHEFFEKVRQATVSTHLADMHSLLANFCIRANGVTPRHAGAPLTNKKDIKQRMTKLQNEDCLQLLGQMAGEAEQQLTELIESIVEKARSSSRSDTPLSYTGSNSSSSVGGGGSAAVGATAAAAAAIAAAAAAAGRGKGRAKHTADSSSTAGGGSGSISSSSGITGASPSVSQQRARDVQARLAQVLKLIDMTYQVRAKDFGMFAATCIGKKMQSGNDGGTFRQYSVEGESDADVEYDEDDYDDCNTTATTAAASAGGGGGGGSRAAGGSSSAQGAKDKSKDDMVNFLKNHTASEVSTVVCIQCLYRLCMHVMVQCVCYFT
jgi:hypothetical protein